MHDLDGRLRASGPYGPDARWHVCGAYAVSHESNTPPRQNQNSSKKHRVGSTEGCYGFVPYEYPEGDAELNGMEVHGMAVLRWHYKNDPAS
jgi:hypothetical protein